MTQYGKPLDVYGFQTLFREIGYYISRLEQHERSLKFFDEALKKTPTDKRALTGRSKARAKVSQYEGALDDVNRALGLDPDDLVVLADKALNTYLCCEFEQGLVQNSRLVPKRQKPDNFAMGVMQCSDAIENCIGERTGRPLRDHFKIIRKLAWKKNYAAQKPFEPKPTNKPKKKKVRVLGQESAMNKQVERVQPKRLLSRKSKVTLGPLLQIKDSLHSKEPDDEFVPPISNPFEFQPLQNYTSNIENYMAEKYLDSMYLDKIFLKKLQSEPGSSCPNEEGSNKIKQLAKNSFKSVSYKQELLRTRRPFYFIKFQEATSSGALKDRQTMELQQKQKSTTMEAEAIVDKMNEAFNNKDLKMCLEMTKKLKRFCDVKPKKFLPNKNVYMEQIFDKVCRAWYQYYRVNPAQNTFEQSLTIIATLGLPLSREPSSDSVTDQFKNVFIDYKKEITELEKIIETADSPEEICWYYHDLSRYYFETKKYDMSRFFARKCIHETEIIGNQYWVFNCLMLMIKSNLAEHNKNDAKNELLRAITCVTDINDQEKIQYLQTCQGIVESFEFEDAFGSKQLELRENKIIQMMASSKMKDEVAHLFRQMAAMPASRRMVVIPGVRAEEKAGAKSLAGKARMSIMPSSDDRASPAAPPSKLSDFID